MPVQITNPKGRSFQLLLAKDKVRLRDPQTGELLHLCGQGTTTNIAWSWLGHRHQAETLRQRAAIRGDDWPFQPVQRDILEPVREVDDA